MHNLTLHGEELWPRSEGEGLHLRSVNWKGDNRCSAQKPSGECCTLLAFAPPSIPGMLFMFDHLTQHIFQRLIQNRRAGDVKPAAATEKPGTIEAST